MTEHWEEFIQHLFPPTIAIGLSWPDGELYRHQARVSAEVDLRPHHAFVKAASRAAPYQPEDLDAAIMANLDEDLRSSTQVIAESIDATPVTGRRRIDRLLDTGVIGLAPLVDLYTAGYQYLR